MEKKLLLQWGKGSPMTITKAFLFMKLTVFFMLLTCMQVSANPGFSQEAKVTLKMKHASISSLLKIIEKKTDYRFVYSNDVLPTNYTVSLDVTSTPVSEVLSHVLNKTGLHFKLIDNELVVIAHPSTIQKFITITGRVTGVNGEPLEGVSVTIRNASGGTFTNADGYYTINAPGDATLIFSYVGFTTVTMPVNNRTNISVVMQGITELSTVTVEGSTGYQKISRERATGAYNVVSSEILEKRPVSNISTALQGMVAGLQANENLDGSVTFLLRGSSSLSGSNQPIVVVDGFRVNRTNFSDINPNDIESITVLKDAAALSVWGAQGAAGVIVITTKVPKVGRTKVEFRGFTRVSNMIDLDQVMLQAKSPDHVAYERLGYERNWLFSPYAGGFSEIGKPLTLAQEFLMDHKNGLITTAELNAELDRLSKIDNRSQFRNFLMRRAVLNQANLSFSGATDRTKTSASILYENNKEGFIKRGYDRVNLNFNNIFTATNFMTVSFGTNVLYRKRETSGAEVGELQGLSPYELLLNEDGSYATNLRGYNRFEMSKLPLQNFPYPDWEYNLLREVRGRELTSEEIAVRLQGGITLNLFKGFSIDGKVQYEKAKTNNEETYEVRNTVNTYLEYNDQTQEIGRVFLPKGGILRTSESNYQGLTIRGQMNFDRQFGQRHQIVFIAGSEMRDLLTTSQTNPTVYGYFPDKLQSTVPPYGYGSTQDQLRTFRSMTTNATLPGGNTSFGWGKQKFVSFYGNAAYTLDGKYTVSGSVRSDASNFITKNPKLRWTPMWSVGAMWNVIREDFMQNVVWINRLNARLTYGSVGLANVGSTSTETLVTVSTTPSTTTGTITASLGNIGNPLLRWEKTYTTNFGIDFSLFRDKLFGKLDIYNKLGKDILGTVSRPSVIGAASATINNAKIYNRGFELELGTNFNITKSLSYNVSVNYAYNKNKVTSLYYPAVYAYDLLGGRNVEGYPVRPVFSYTYLGMKDGIPYVEGPNKTENPFNNVALHNQGLGLPFLNYEGTEIPPHTLGWINNFKYKNFNMMVVVVGTFGGLFRAPTFNYATTVGSSKTSVDRFVADVFAGNPGLPDFPKPNETQSYLWDRYTPYLDALVESSSFLDLKEIDLEYNLPKNIAAKASFSNIKLYAQVRDLGLLYKANSRGFHPEWLPGSNRPVTTYTFGVNLQF
jgi:TonB-linked SusC/RagA family outer membrane protein